MRIDRRKLKQVSEKAAVAEVDAGARLAQLQAKQAAHAEALQYMTRGGKKELTLQQVSEIQAKFKKAAGSAGTIDETTFAEMLLDL